MIRFSDRFLAADIVIKAELATKERLERLFSLPEIIVVTEEGDELEPQGQIYPFTHNEYFVTNENMLDIIEQSPDGMHLTHQQKSLFLSRAAAMMRARQELIQELYRPRHPQLYSWPTIKSEIFLPEFEKAVTALREGDSAPLIALLKKETETGIYTFPMVRPSFCQLLLDEVDNFEQSGLPVSRPNSMNRYGVILSDIGLGGFFDHLLGEVMRPIASLVFPGPESELDHHHTFVVQYAMAEDRELDFHYDDSEITLNICLGKEFTGGDLYFSGLLEDPSTHSEKFQLAHRPGVAVLHRGHHRHGALAIQSGQRSNLIIWGRALKVRTQGHSHQHNHEHGDHEHEHNADCHH